MSAWGDLPPVDADAELEEFEEPEPEEYDPGPECDDEGGMSEYRYWIMPGDYGWETP